MRTDLRREGGAIKTHAACSACLIATLVAVAACGGGGSNPPTTQTQHGTMHDAIVAPVSKVLHSGQSYHVPKHDVEKVGWQVSCTSHGVRVNAEQVRGQQTATGTVVSYGGGSPSIVVNRNNDGSLTIHCR